MIGGARRGQVWFVPVGGTEEYRGATARADTAPAISSCLASDRHGIVGEDGGRVEERPVMLGAVEAVAKADAIRAPRG
ncbi:hypothetical protein B1218_35060, partial [Pseudomonas ogarae]